MSVFLQVLSVSSSVPPNLHLESVLDGKAQFATNVVSDVLSNSCPYSVVPGVGIVLQQTEQSLQSSVHDHSELVPQQNSPAVAGFVPQVLASASLPRPPVHALTNLSHLVTDSMQELIFQSLASGLPLPSCDEIGQQQQQEFTRLASLQMISQLQQGLVPSLLNQNAIPQKVQNVSAINHQTINQMPDAMSSQSSVQIPQAAGELPAVGIWSQTLDHVPPTATHLLPGLAPIPQALASVHQTSITQMPQISMQIAQALDNLSQTMAHLPEAVSLQDVVHVPQFVGQWAVNQKQMVQLSQAVATGPHVLPQVPHTLTDLPQITSQVGQLPDTVLQMAQTLSLIPQNRPVMSQSGAVTTPMPQTVPKMLPAGTVTAQFLPPVTQMLSQLPQAVAVTTPALAQTKVVTTNSQPPLVPPAGVVVTQVLTPVLPTMPQTSQIGVVTTQAFSSMSQTAPQLPQTVASRTQENFQMPTKGIETAQAVEQVPKMSQPESSTQAPQPIPYMPKGETQMPLVPQVLYAVHETPLNAGTHQESVGQAPNTDGNVFQSLVTAMSKVASVPVESIVQQLASLPPASLIQFPLVTAFLQNTLSSLSNQMLSHAPVGMADAGQHQQQQYSTTQLASNQLQHQPLPSFGLNEQQVLPQNVQEEHILHKTFAQQPAPVPSLSQVVPSINLNPDPLVTHNNIPDDSQFSAKVPVLANVGQSFFQSQSNVMHHGLPQANCPQPAGSLVNSAHQPGDGISSIMEKHKLLPGLSLPVEQRMLTDLKRLLVGFGITPEVAEQAINLYPHMHHMNFLSGNSGLLSYNPLNQSSDGSNHPMTHLAPSEFCPAQELPFHMSRDETVPDLQTNIQMNGSCNHLDVEPLPCSVETCPVLEQGLKLSKSGSGINVHGKLAIVTGSSGPKGTGCAVQNMAPAQEAETCQSPFLSLSDSVTKVEVRECGRVPTSIAEVSRGQLLSCVTEKETFSGPQMSSSAGFTSANTEHVDQTSMEQVNEIGRHVTHNYNCDFQNSCMTRAAPAEYTMAASMLFSDLVMREQYLDASRDVNARVTEVMNNSHQEKVKTKQNSTELADAEVAFCLGEEFPQRTMPLSSMSTTGSSSRIQSSVEALLEVDTMGLHSVQKYEQNVDSKSSYPDSKSCSQSIIPHESEMSSRGHQIVRGRRKDRSFTPSDGYLIDSPLSMDEVDGQQTERVSFWANYI